MLPFPLPLGLGLTGTLGIRGVLTIAGPLPAITLHHVVTLRGSTSEGAIVETVAPAWFEIMALIAKDPEEIYRIGPRRWEEIIAGAYERAGFDEVILTPRSGDKGRDVIATKNGIGSVRVVEQVKAYRPGHLGTADEVRALIGVVALEQNVTKGFVTTTSDFAPRLRDDELIKRVVPYRVELKAKTELLAWLNKLMASEKP